VIPLPAESQGALTGPRAEAPEGDVPAVSLRGLWKSFGSVDAVAGVDLDVREGEFFSMLGPSGSGKTTVLRLIAGFEAPTAGTVQLAGQDVTGKAPFERNVTTVFQDYALFPHMSVLENVAYGLRVRGVGRAERRERAAEALRTVALAGTEGRGPTQLSGGQRQRVALARALVVDPQVLLLDEPLGALDLKLREQMQVELKEIQRRVGITFVFVTHDQEEALTLSDRIAVFNEGRIEQVGPAEEVYERPTSRFVAGFVGTSNLISGHAAERLLGRTGTFAVRPEKIRLHRNGSTPSTDVRADGTVADVVYAGSLTRYLVDLEAGPRVVVAVQNQQAGVEEPEELRGSRVVVGFDQSSCRPVDDDGTGEASDTTEESA
jgi:putative spermidine/putrescine transport system ATP-binding protein